MARPRTRTGEGDPPLCPNCGRNQVEIQKGKYWRKLCRYCRKAASGPTSHVISRMVDKSGPCERCGFIPEDQCQMDIHHIDGDRRNNDPSNHQRLCANCHRLITRRAAQLPRKSIEALLVELKEAKVRNNRHEELMIRQRLRRQGYKLSDPSP